jgi:hypothetical protein
VDEPESSSRVETEGKAIIRFGHGSESREETEGNAADDAIWRFMSRLELSGSESLLGSNAMLLEDYGLERWWWKVEG